MGDRLKEGKAGTALMSVPLWLQIPRQRCRQDPTAAASGHLPRQVLAGAYWNPWTAVTSRGELYICRIPPVLKEKCFSSTQKES